MLENFVGLLSTSGETDFRLLCGSLYKIGCRFGAVVTDASRFVFQSRPRAFLVAVRQNVPILAALRADLPQARWYLRLPLRGRGGLPTADAASWIWWSPDASPAEKDFELEDIIDLSNDTEWTTDEAIDGFTEMITLFHLDRFATAEAGR